MIYKDGDIVTTASGEQYRVLYATKRDIEGQHLSLRVKPVNKKHRKGLVLDVDRITNVERKQ